MTVASAVSRISYNGNGSTTAFAVPYYFLENSHLRVILRSSAGAETVQTITTNYTVTGAGNPAGGTVNMLVAPASGETLTILRDVPETQETDYQANDPFPAESHERALDKLTMIAQQIADESGRAIKIPETETSNTTLPVSGTRANKLLGFGPTGDVSVTNSTITQVDAAVSSFVNATGNNAASILYDPAGTGAQQTTVQAKLREIISVKDFGAVGDGIADDTSEIQAADAAAAATNAILTFPAGTYYFSSDLTFTAPVEMTGGVLYGSNYASFPEGFYANPYYCLQCPTRAITSEKVNVKWYGAKGDGSGDTPADDGISISSAPWNTWDNTGWKDNLPWSPYNSGGSFSPSRAKPFADDDTWDFIGASRALWGGEFDSRTTYFPAGRYLINVSSTTSKGTYNGLSIMRDMSQNIEGDGVYETYITTKENAAFFAANNPSTTNAYQIFNFYRIGGPPTNIQELSILGPNNYGVTTDNLTCIWCRNINGVTFRELWLSAARYGIYAQDYSGDSHAKSITSEYLFGAAIYTDVNSSISVNFCNFWVISGSDVGGVIADGYGYVTNSRFINFNGRFFKAGSGIFSNNLVSGITVNGQMLIEDNGVVSGNYFNGGSNNTFVYAEKNTSITGNVFYNTGSHSSIRCGDTSASSATNIVISSNTFIKTDATSAAYNYAIIADESGVSYTGGATASMFIIGNTFQGRALTSIGSASIKDNIFSGTYTA